MLKQVLKLVCVLVCTYVYMCVCVCACLHACEYSPIHSCVSVFLFVFEEVKMYVMILDRLGKYEKITDLLESPLGEDSDGEGGEDGDG